MSRGDRDWVITYYGGPVNLASGFCFDKETSDGNDKGRSITHDVILPLERLELLGVVVLEQGHVHIDRHGQVPKCIGSQKPITHQLAERIWIRPKHSVPLHLNQKSLKLAEVGCLARART